MTSAYLTWDKEANEVEDRLHAIWREPFVLLLFREQLIQVHDRRLLRPGRLNRGGMMLAAAMNGFYGMKRLTGNGPIELTVCGEGRIVHAVSQGANSHATR